MKQLMVAILVAGLTMPALAKGGGHVSRGGHYAGGNGTSHKGGSYKNSRTHNHYQKRR